MAAACAPVPRFPPPRVTVTGVGATELSFDLDRNGRPDYWQYCDASGRVRTLAFPADARGRNTQHVDLDAIPADDCPHYLIVLDGVPFEVVAELRRAGLFRLFHPPARVICGYPSMTDLALAELFRCGPCPAYQALSLDRAGNRLTNSTATYLSGRNSPWVHDVDYRCSFWWDVLVYLDPQTVFDHELNGLRKTFDRHEEGLVSGYSVGSAGLGTRAGRRAMEQYLRAVDQFCERLVYERRGRVKITLTADHGHNLVTNRLVSFDKLLADAGYRPARALHGPRDVVTIAYGLVTYAEFFTADPGGVGACLLRHPDVEFVAYPEGDAVVVRDQRGVARVTSGPQGYRYDAAEADPLRLRPVINRLRQAGNLSPDGVIEERALFRATIEHDYPDPLDRLWRAFHGLAENPPDLIANLRDGACHGSAFFHAMIGRVSSTHGSLNRRNSTTFAMTMLGELPPALRTRDVLPILAWLAASQTRSGTAPVVPHRLFAQTDRAD